MLESQSWYSAERPPSTVMQLALMNGASSDARNTAVIATSSGRPMRFIGGRVERGLLRGGRIGLLVPPVVRQLRFDVARRDRVDPHVARRVFDAERARQADHAVLRHRIRKTARNDLERMRRGNIHDAARAAFDHARQHRAATVPHAVEIDREAAPPVVVGHGQRVAEHVDAGVVHQHVERTEACFGLAHRVLNRRATASRRCAPRARVRRFAP